MLSSVVLAGGERAASSAQALIDILKPFNGLSGNFEQVVIDANGDEVQRVQGLFTAAKPDLLSWHTEPPYEQLIVADGERIWLYDPDLEQVTVYRNDLSRTPAVLLVGETDDLQQTYQVTTSVQDGRQSYRLAPLDSNSLYSRIELEFEDNVPVAMTLWDSLEQQTRIVFHDLVVNPAVDRSLFTFEVPPGVDLIHND